MEGKKFSTSRLLFNRQILLKGIFTGLILMISLNQLKTQTPHPLNFSPHHEGDIRQYRSIFTNEMIRTEYIDSIVVDSVSKDKLIYARSMSNSSTNPTVFRIDTNANVYNNNFNPDGIRYKLYADSGDTWIYREADSVNTDTVIIRVVDVYNSHVFGISTTVKAFQFEIHFPELPIFWVGVDHLAKGFGLIRTDVEPSDVYALTGAIIVSVEYGNITLVNDKSIIPNTFDLIQNYPNPFNPTTKTRYEIAKTVNVKLKVINILGEEVAILVNEEKHPGSYEVEFNANSFNRQICSGVYIAVLQTNEARLTRSMLLIK